MSFFDDIFKNIQERELTDTEKVEYVEDILRDSLRDMALTRDDIFAKAMKDKTVFMVRKGQSKLKKFSSDDKMYISIPETVYDDIKNLDDFEQYKYISELASLTMSADEYKENEKGEVISEAELIDKACKKVENTNGEVLRFKDEIVYDDYGQPEKLKDDKTFFEPKKYIAKDEPKDEDDEAAEEASKNEDEEESTSESTSQKEISTQKVNDDLEQEEQEIEKQMEVNYEAQYTSQSITEQDQETLNKIKGSLFQAQNIISKKELIELNKTAKDISKSLEGYFGKTKRLNPAKRISNKSICSDISDKIYIGKDYVNGRFIDQNLAIDCSGSMWGKPIKDAIKLCYIFNKIAQDGFLEGNILLSESRKNFLIKMPVHDDVILSLGGTGGGEGLAKNIKVHQEELKGKNLIVVTDGSIVDSPLEKKYWQKHKINAIGVYINESVKAENLPGYDKNLLRWFPKKIVRNSFEEMIQKLIQVGLKASKK